MKRVILIALGLMSLLGSSCTQSKYAQTSVSQAISSPVTTTFPWGEVYCGHGEVCAEVEVVRVDVQNKDGGRVEVILHNRTFSTVAVQISLEIIDENGAATDRTNFYNVPLQPRQEKPWHMPNLMKKDHKVRVSLRTP